MKIEAKPCNRRKVLLLDTGVTREMCGMSAP